MGYLTLRLAGPCCPLDPRWTQEDLEECTQRVMGRLHDLTCGGSRRLGSPAFCFAFPLLRLVLASPDSGDQLVTQCLQVLSAHSFMRAKEPLSLVSARRFTLLLGSLSRPSADWTDNHNRKTQRQVSVSFSTMIRHQPACVFTLISVWLSRLCRLIWNPRKFELTHCHNHWTRSQA